MALSLTAKVWGLRILIIAAIVLLCVLARSPVPSWALGIAWSPNGLFLVAYTKGVLRFPRALERVHRAEPILYRWLGVSLVKRIVTNDLWPRINALTPAPLPRNRQDFLKRIEGDMKLAEICHVATFSLASCIALLYVAVGQESVALWISSFNVALNAYPVMLQRCNRWRLQQARIHGTREMRAAA